MAVLCGVCLSSARAQQSPWLPVEHQFIISPAYSFETFDKFWFGKTKVSLKPDDSVQHTAYLGWLVRGMHFWGANLLIVVALLHMTFIFWNGGYRSPRELNWMAGVLVFLVIILFSFTGSLLPWDANEYLSRAREMSIISGSGVLPAGVSEFIKYAVQGGPLVGPATLLRFFMAHVFLLPGLMVLILYIHFRLGRKQGPAQPA